MNNHLLPSMKSDMIKNHLTQATKQTVWVQNMLFIFMEKESDPEIAEALEGAEYILSSVLDELETALKII